MARRLLLAQAAVAALALAMGACDAEPTTGDSFDTRSPAATTEAEGLADAGPPPKAAVPTSCDSYTDSLGDRDWAIIYYARTGLAPPLEQWADEALSGMGQELGAEEAWKRANAQVDAQWKAVKDIRCVTVRTRADPQAYDASLGGMPLGALAPDIFFPFRDGAMALTLKFRNADAARIWKMPAGKAAALQADGSLGNAELIIRARIASARPTGSGGAIEADIVGFDIEPPEYSRIARETVTVAP